MATDFGNPKTAAARQLAIYLAQGYAAANAASADASYKEAVRLRETMLRALDDPGGHLRANIAILRGANGRWRVVVRGVAAARAAQAAAGHKPGRDYDLGLQFEYGSRKIPAKPFFHAAVRRQAPQSRQAIAEAAFVALYDPRFFPAGRLQP